MHNCKSATQETLRVTSDVQEKCPHFTQVEIIIHKITKMRECSIQIYPTFTCTKISVIYVWQLKSIYLNAANVATKAMYNWRSCQSKT